MDNEQDAATRRTDRNAVAVLYALLQALGVQVTKTTVEQELVLHPDYPSLLSLRETLDGWGLETAALPIDRVEQLGELPLPLLTHWHQPESEYILITGIAESVVTGWHDTRGTIRLPMAEFSQYWSRVVLLAEPTEGAGEVNYVANRNTEWLRAARLPLVSIGLVVVTLLLLLRVAASWTAVDWIWLLTKAGGLLASGLLVQKQLGLANSLTDRLCRVHSAANCGDVLTSPAATLWGWLSWTDVGLIYFAGGWLATLFMTIEPAIRSLVGWLSLLALPYTLFSLYYQAQVVRRWCPLCLVVQAMLLLDGGLTGVHLAPLPRLPGAYSMFLVAYLVPIIGWIPLKALLVKAAQVPMLQDELRIFWRNAPLFQTLLRQQPVMPALPPDLMPIRLGSAQAEHMLTVVANPYCRHCARTHRELTQLLVANPHVQAQLVFFACDGPAGPHHQAVRHLLQAQAGQAGTAVLDRWYNKSPQVYTDWAKQYPITGDEAAYTRLAEQQCAWCRQAGVVGTPTLYVDGYQLPHPYWLPHLRWLLQGIAQPISS